jgi:hypothetical protein
MTKLISTCLATLAFGALALAQTGGAQGRGQRGPQIRYDHSGAQYGLAARADVQTSLGLSDDAKAAITKAGQDRRAATRAARTDHAGDKNGTDSAVGMAMDGYDKTVGRALNTLQNRRLMEIFVQMANGKALEDPDVQKSLDFTTEQKGKVEKMVREDAIANTALQAKRGSGEIDDSQLVAARRTNEQTLNANLLVVLTTEQQPKFAAMDGEKFSPDPTIR